MPLKHLLVVIFCTLICLWYLSIQVVSVTIHNLTLFSYYMYKSIFKIPTIKQVWLFIPQGDYTSPVDVRVHLFMQFFVKPHCDFFPFVGQINLVSGRSFHLGR